MDENKPTCCCGDCKEPDSIVKNPGDGKPDTGGDESDTGASGGDEPLQEIGDASALAEDGDPDSIPTDGDAERDLPNRPEKGFFGQVVSRRHPLLIALVLAFAFFLAVAPLLFRYQKSAMSDALVIYKSICEATSTGRINDDWMKSVSGPDLIRMRSDDRDAFFKSIQCVDLNQYKTALRPMKGRQFGANRAYVLSIHQGKDIGDAEKKGMPIINLFFPVVSEELKIDLMPVSN